MATFENVTQLVQGQTKEKEIEDVRTSPSPSPSPSPSSSDEERPRHKSIVDPSDEPADQNRRFDKQDKVHMSVRQNGVRTRGVYKVSKSRYNKEEAYWEYQLENDDGKLYKNGTWIREKELKIEKKA